ncbi:MAG: tyrosine-type recombinase/integrase [Clostridia bacterium]
MTINCGIIAEFKNYLMEEEKSFSTVDKYVRDVNKFAQKIGDEEITKAKLLEYKTALCKSYAPSSVNGAISSLNAFFDFVQCPNLKLKSVKIQRKIFMSKEKELSKKEYERLVRTAKEKKNKRLFYLMQTICSTGIRVSELRFVTVGAVKSGEVQINLKGKIRCILLPGSLIKMLKQYIKEEKIKKGPVFVTKNGKPLDRSNIWHDMKNLCTQAGVDSRKVFPHNLRHLFARAFYSIQKDIVRLADILGHSSINTTRIYTMETGDIHLKQIEKLGLVCFIGNYKENKNTT